MTIKAIQTEYRGYKFRSRLEARWAVFFESMGWKWKYEHQGFNLGWNDAGETHIKWLPDFEIEIPSFCGGQRAYVEVKGDKNAFKDGRFCESLDFGGGPPLFDHSFRPAWLNDASFETGQVMPIVVLGDIPHQQWGALFLKVIGHSKGICTGWFMVNQKKLIGNESSVLWDAFRQERQHDSIAYSMEDFDPIIIPTRLADKTIMDALDDARSARFEHGETPR